MGIMHNARLLKEAQAYIWHFLSGGPRSDIEKAEESLDQGIELFISLALKNDSLEREIKKMKEERKQIYDCLPSYPMTALKILGGENEN